MSPDATEIGTGVRLTRARLHWTQRELAEHAGISHQMVSFVEKGAKNVTIGTLSKILTALDPRARLEVVSDHPVPQ